MNRRLILCKHYFTQRDTNTSNQDNVHVAYELAACEGSNATTTTCDATSGRCDATATVDGVRCVPASHQCADGLVLQYLPPNCTKPGSTSFLFACRKRVVFSCFNLSMILSFSNSLSRTMFDVIELSRLRVRQQAVQVLLLANDGTLCIGKEFRVCQHYDNVSCSFSDRKRSNCFHNHAACLATMSARPPMQYRKLCLMFWDSPPSKLQIVSQSVVSSLRFVVMRQMLAM
jgi:hypothetical protein